MIYAIALFLVFLIFFGLTFVLTGSAMNGPWSSEGPARISASLKRRNRLLLVGVLAVLAVVILLEFVLYDFHSALVDLQYSIGEAFGYYEGSNGGFSWLLYLMVFLGTLLGVVFGSLVSVRRFAITRGLGPADVL